MAFDVTYFDPIHFQTFDSTTDIAIELMMILKTDWSLSGDLTGSGVNAIQFRTGFFDSEVQFPQVIVSQVAGDSSPPLSMGATDTFYRNTDLLNVGLWVRPKQDSNTSFGWAKNTIYQMRKEVERICFSGSRLNTTTEDRFLFPMGWKGMPEDRRPVILHQSLRMGLVKHLKGVGT